METNWKPVDFQRISFRLKQSVIRQGMEMKMILKENETKQIEIPLVSSEKAVSFPLKADEWQWISVDVLQSLKAQGVTDEDLQKMTIKTVIFNFSGYRSGENVYMDDFFIHGVPKDGSKDVLSGVAFDASGVANLVMTMVDAERKDVWSVTFPNGKDVELNALRKRFQGLAWFRCEYVDKVGNHGIPFWLPLIGTADGPKEGAVTAAAEVPAEAVQAAD